MYLRSFLGFFQFASYFAPLALIKFPEIRIRMVKRDRSAVFKVLSMEFYVIIMCNKNLMRQCFLLS